MTLALDDAKTRLDLDMLKQPVSIDASADNALRALAALIEAAHDLGSGEIVGPFALESAMHGLYQSTALVPSRGDWTVETMRELGREQLIDVVAAIEDMEE